MGATGLAVKKAALAPAVAEEKTNKQTLGCFAGARSSNGLDLGCPQINLSIQLVN